MLGGMLESGLRNFFRSNLPLWWPAKRYANPTLNLGATGAGGWTLSLWSSATLEKFANFFRQQSPGHSTHGAAEQSWNLGCRLDAVAVVFGEFGNVYNLVSVNSPLATEHMVLQSKTGLCDADKL